MEAATCWFGAFVLDGARVVKAFPSPRDTPALLARIRQRRNGELTPEDSALLTEYAGQRLVTRDRRLATRDILFDSSARGSVDPSVVGASGAELRGLLLQDADEALRLAWDPSIHVEEAVRALSELAELLNLLGERLTSWTSRDAPEIESGDHEAAVERANLGGPASTSLQLPEPDPELLEARRELASLFKAAQSARRSLENALEQAVPRRAPNLVTLLGPSLSARLLAKAGGLDRLARLPASTIQVLGAERAFFEHLRGKAPPPRHGLLFLHPQIQSASRAQRGKLARALAGKVAIAARVDSQGHAVNPSLAQAFERRLRDVRAAAASRSRARGREGRPKTST
jgi:nucleolar protein 56